MKKSILMLPLEWTGIALALVVLPFLSHRILLVLCDFISLVMYRFDRRGRALAEENLKMIAGNLSSAAAERIIRRSYRNMARTVGHLAWTSFFARRRAAAVGIMSAEGKSFLAANKPAITVSAHIGCWEILSQLAFLEGHRMVSVAKDIGTPAMTRLLMRSRRSIGQEIVPAEGAFKTLMAGVRDGRSLGLLVDQHVDPKDGGLWIRFLGRPIPVSAAPAFFSAKAKAPIVTAWSRPLKDGRYRCEVINAYSAEEARDVWAMTQRCAQDIEKVVRRHPSCWVLNYNYFSNVPSEKDLEQLAKREGVPFVPRVPREVTYFSRPGFEGACALRLAADLRVQAGSCPLDITLVLPDTPAGRNVDMMCRKMTELIPDVAYRSVTHADPPMRVAVLVPAYNVERYLSACLDSLLSQSMPVDVFCCDDGSTDGTGRILDDYAARFPRIHAFRHPNRGMSATYNRLLDELPPEYEAFGIVDSDDYVHPDMYATLATALQRTDADVSECGIVAAAADDVPPAGFAAVETAEEPRIIDDMSVYWLRQTAPAGWISKWNKLYRRRVCGSFRFREGLDYEDDFFYATEINAAIRRKVIVPQRYYAYRRNPGSLNGKINFRKYVSSAALRLRLSCETFLVTGRIPKNLEAGWRCDLVKDAYRMLVRKNLKKNGDPALRRELFLHAGDELRKLVCDFGLKPEGLSIVQRLVYGSCLQGRYGLANILVKLT